MNEWHLGQSVAMWALTWIAVVYAMGAVILSRLPQLRHTWRGALLVTTTALGFAVVGALGLALGGAGSAPISVVPGIVLDVRLDVLTVLMASLISFIAVIILRYAQHYLDGDPGEARFVQWFLATLASVSLLIVTNHLFVMALGWMATSLCLHQLLTFYRARPQAVLAAHKKFLLSRLADTCLITGFVLVWWHYGTFHIDEIIAQVSVYGGVLPAMVQTATVLIAIAAILKCAQLPFHGWLIQVMEAPTPVSALLHAGIVNIGGFLLIRLAPLMSESPLAQWVLVIVGSLTAVLAGLIMMTRISVKVMLAWSTCAQMGFMLMECGLGAYALALLHLLAHSLYKAHAFLSSGRAVEYCTTRRLIIIPFAYRLQHWFAASALGIGVVALAATLFGVRPADEPALWALAGIVSVGVATLSGEAFAVRNTHVALRMAGSGLGISVLYFIWHHLFVTWVDLPAVSAAPVAGTVAWVVTLFTIQFILYAASRSMPDHPVISQLHAYLYHGLYLDEIFTRLTFLLWPPQQTRSVSSEVATIAPYQQEGVRL
jgi:NAD(P)H-quinone oxidoreductase subunit 5